MKKSIVFGVVLALVLSVSSCSTTGVETDYANLKEPPGLTVSCGEQSIEALRGTTYWMYEDEDGTGTSTNSDSMHPLQAKEYMTPLLLTNTDPQAAPLTAYLYFSTVPDEVNVRCWSEEYWEQTGAESEAVDVSYSEGGVNEPKEPFAVSLKDGAYIYEITAEWNSAVKYKGTVHYSFCTAPEGI